MNESVVNFGPAAGLVGVLNEPEKRKEDAPAVVILNAGIIHRAGPNRMHVRLACALASAGIPSLRIDMAGIGDSQGLGSTESQDEECLASISASIDLLESRGTARRFVLYGACSGAVYAFRYARRDPRVVGVAGVDPPTIDRSLKYHLLRALAAVKRPVVWYRLITGRYRVTPRIRSLVGPGQSPSNAAQTSDVSRRHAATEALAEMVRRGVQLLLLITGNFIEQRYNYQSQLFDVFPGLGLEGVTKVTMLPTANHTFSREADRSALEGELLHWIAEASFPLPAMAPAPLPSSPEATTS